MTKDLPARALPGREDVAALVRPLAGRLTGESEIAIVAESTLVAGRRSVRHLVLASASGTLGQVFLRLLPERPGANVDVLGLVDGRYAVDGLSDPETAQLLVDTMSKGSRLGPLSATTFEIANWGEPRLRERTSSNTSLTSGSVHVKVLGLLRPGDQREVLLPQAIADNAPIARPVATLSADLLGTTTLLAIATDHVDGVDGYASAIASCRAGAPWPWAAAAGLALGQLHRALESAFGSTTPSADDATQARAQLRAALDRVTVEPIERVDGLLRTTPTLGPVTQIVHGDMHLGQLLVGDKVTIVDFEGPPGESVPLLPVEADVASLLRSVDYAATEVEVLLGGDARAAHQWALSTRAEILDGYQASGIRLDTDRLRLYEVARAAHEVAYDRAARPAQRPVSERALSRLMEQL